jgi:hypothetical protein
MLRAAVCAAALASAAAFAPISAPTGLQLRAKNVARAPRAGELVGNHMDALAGGEAL